MHAYVACPRVARLVIGGSRRDRHCAGSVPRDAHSGSTLPGRAIRLGAVRCFRCELRSATVSCGFVCRFVVITDSQPSPYRRWVTPSMHMISTKQARTGSRELWSCQFQVQETNVSLGSPSKSEVRHQPCKIYERSASSLKIVGTGTLFSVQEERPAMSRSVNW